MRDASGKRVASAPVAVMVSNPAPPPGNHYYVDSAGGSDANSGASESEAWRTLAPVHSKTFQPGDTVHFKRGGSWTGPLTIRNSGVSDRPITFTDYGSGPKPVFSNPGVPFGRAVVIQASWVVVENLLARDAHEAGIFIASGTNNIVRNCEFTHVGTGVTVSGQYNLITGNYAHDLTMIVNTPDGDDDYGAVGYWLNAPNNEVSYNRCVNCKAPSYDYGTDGGVVELNRNADNSYIHHNWGENSNGFLEAGGGSAQNVRLAYNVSYNNGDLACLHIDGKFATTITNLRIENNTIVQTRNAPILFDCLSAISPGMLSARNNIFYTAARVFPGGSFIHENNVYGLLGAAGVGVGLGPNERIADPMLADVNAKDFHLRPESPAIGRGRNLGYTADFDGVPVPQDAPPDIGAYQFVRTP